MKDYKGYKLFIHNDDVNTFENIIISLIDVCGHDVLQAEQCATLVHFKGGTVVKSGEFEDVSNMKYKLESMGINASVQFSNISS